VGAMANLGVYFVYELLQQWEHRANRVNCRNTIVYFERAVECLYCLLLCFRVSFVCLWRIYLSS